GFTFRGRSARSEYWWVALLTVALGFVVSIAGMGFAFSASSDEGTLGALGVLFLVLVGISLLQLPVAVRRFHDRNMTGWWYLLLAIVPSLLGVIDETMGSVCQMAGSIAYIVIFCLRGTVGPNRFGDDPLEPGFYSRFGIGARPAASGAAEAGARPAASPAGEFEFAPAGAPAAGQKPAQQTAAAEGQACVSPFPQCNQQGGAPVVRTSNVHGYAGTTPAEPDGAPTASDSARGAAEEGKAAPGSSCPACGAMPQTQQSQQMPAGGRAASMMQQQ
ncbi:MAG: DUF805 domain-containing protein, partial [Desulfovibrionaceae bacterium]|nr:DUF805 domain-containing protein [Desulfovibrionaceae bacterium]